jgi:hypothetical protein
MIFLELLAGITIVGLVLYKGIQLQRGLGSVAGQVAVEDTAGEVDANSDHTSEAKS